MRVAQLVVVDPILRAGRKIATKQAPPPTLMDRPVHLFMRFFALFSHRYWEGSRTYLKLVLFPFYVFFLLVFFQVFCFLSRLIGLQTKQGKFCVHFIRRLSGDFETEMSSNRVANEEGGVLWPFYMVVERGLRRLQTK